MEKVRGFEVAKGFEDKNINLPVRKTKKSAGYDMEVKRRLHNSSIQIWTKTNFSKNGT